MKYFIGIKLPGCMRRKKIHEHFVNVSRFPNDMLDYPKILNRANDFINTRTYKSISKYNRFYRVASLLKQHELTLLRRETCTILRYKIHCLD